MTPTPEEIAARERYDLHAELFYSFIDDFKKTTRYVSLALDNLKTYSIEYLRLLLDICSEIDDVAKIYWERSKPGTLPRRTTIDDWRGVILGDNPGFYRMTLVIGGRIECKPWENWGLSPIKNPDWWDVYNGVKHNRSEHFRQANQGIVVDALCGLAGLCISAFQIPYVWQQSYVLFLRNS